MTPAQLVLFFWNGETGSSLSILEELLVVARKEGLLQPVLSDSASMVRFRVGPWDKNEKHFLQKTLKQAVLGHIPYLPLTQLSGILKAVCRKEYQEKFEGFRYFIAADENIFEHFSITPARVLCLLKPDPSAASFLYNLLRKAFNKHRDYPEVLIMVRDIRKIEDAAEFFSKVQKEVSALLDGEITMRFCGNIALNDEKLSIAAREGTRPLSEIFQGDSLHGQLKNSAKIITKICTADLAGDEAMLLEIAGKLSKAASAANSR